MRIDQVIPSLASRDAIGAHTLALTAALRARGIDSDVFYGTCTEDVLDKARPLAGLGRPSSDRALLYQASIGDPLFEVFAERPETKMVNYHNITPVELFAWWEPSVAYELSLGRSQLRRLAPHCHFAVADSAFNEAELIEAGFARTAVSPLLIEFRRAEPDPAVARRLGGLKADGSPDFLFVGKVAPHKAQHDLVKMLAVYRRLYHPHARLHIVGLPVGTTYGPALDGFIAELGLDDAVSVGPATPAELEAYYQATDVFVCASEHEGFCVPLIEAMAHDVPIVAYSATAVPETVAGAGLLLDSKAPLAFAATVHRVVSDDRLRARLMAAGTRRAADFALPVTRAHFVDVLVGAL
ncbi:MAG TPA: glycosyltransferase family 4 protein, partial [Acidimicrobiales bacterium]|nr:glycosyltransferase family 4 protein [Acidimicrobiales bacterium]